jgi:short-subunit dehydrogenase
MNRVVVVTGASGGIGRELAVQLAERGDTVVLAARREEALDETAEQCRRLGAEVSIVPTDVSNEAEVARLRDAALTAWGRIDAWINNAGVTYFATLTEGSMEDHIRVIQTNLFGPMYGARAVVPHFRERGRGVLINVSSILGKTGQPFVPSYVISKFGLRGLSEALRTELADEPEIHVCTIFPYATDTPHFELAGTDITRRARAMPPAQSPEKVASAIVRLVDHPRREVHVPPIALAGLAFRRLFPRASERLLLHALREFHFDERVERPDAGNLYEPKEGPGHVHGDRPPQVSTPRFALWATRELAKIEAEQARRWWSRSRERMSGSDRASRQGRYGGDRPRA